MTAFVVRSGAVFACAQLVACSDPLSDVSASLPEGAHVVMTVEPDGSLDAIAPVSRFVFRGSGGSVPDGSEVSIYRGALSAYHLGKIRSGNLPSTLLERQVPVRKWRTGGLVTVAPTEVLVAGETYSVATASGYHAEVIVGDDETRPVLRRVWPPPESSEGGPLAIYCGDRVDLGTGVRIDLSPGSIPAVVEPGAVPGVMEGECVRVRATEPLRAGTWFMMPPVLKEHLFEPAPIEVVLEAEPQDGACETNTAWGGPGCATVQDDRVIVQSMDTSAFYAVKGPGFEWAGALEASGRAVVRGLVPNSRFVIDLWVVTVGGHLWEGRFALSTAGPRARVVINEVYANALGAEPEQEWVELYNDGLLTVSLAGWELQDAGGRVAIGELALDPGCFALLVRDDFDPDASADPEPAGGSTLVRLAVIGKNGLSNAGEALTLWTAAGTVSSRFPGTPKPKAGISVGRRFPWALDDDPASFAYHSGSGASPGAQNRVD